MQIDIKQNELNYMDVGRAAFLFLSLAVQKIDEIFGQNYALKNPALVIAMIKTMQVEFDKSAPNAPPPTAQTSGTSPPAVTL